MLPKNVISSKNNFYRVAHMGSPGLDQPYHMSYQVKCIKVEPWGGGAEGNLPEGGPEAHMHPNKGQK